MPNSRQFRSSASIWALLTGSVIGWLRGQVGTLWSTVAKVRSGRRTRRPCRRNPSKAWGTSPRGPGAGPRRAGPGHPPPATRHGRPRFSGPTSAESSRPHPTASPRHGQPVRSGPRRLPRFAIGHLARPVAVWFRDGRVAASLHHPHDLTDNPLRLAPVPHVEVNLHGKLAESVLRELRADLARRLQAEGRLVENALPEALDLPVPELVVEVPRAAPDPVDDHGSHKARVVAQQRVSPDDQVVALVRLLLHVAHDLLEHALKTELPVRRADELHRLTVHSIAERPSAGQATSASRCAPGALL